MAEKILCENCGHELDKFKHQIVGVIWFDKFIGISKTIYLHWIKNNRLSALKCHCGCINPDPEPQTKQARLLQNLLLMRVTHYILLKAMLSEIPEAELNKTTPTFPKYKFWELRELIMAKTPPEIIENFYQKGLVEITLRKSIEKMEKLKLLYIEKTPAHNDTRISLNNKYHKAIALYCGGMDKLFENLKKEEGK